MTTYSVKSKSRIIFHRREINTNFINPVLLQFSQRSCNIMYVFCLQNTINTSTPVHIHTHVFQILTQLERANIWLVMVGG